MAEARAVPQAWRHGAAQPARLCLWRLLDPSSAIAVVCCAVSCCGQVQGPCRAAQGDPAPPAAQDGQHLRHRRQPLIGAARTTAAAVAAVAAVAAAVPAVLQCLALVGRQQQQKQQQQSLQRHGCVCHAAVYWPLPAVFGPGWCQSRVLALLRCGQSATRHAQSRGAGNGSNT